MIGIELWGKDMEYLKLFNLVQINYQYQIELIVLDNNTWNHLIVCKSISSS